MPNGFPMPVKNRQRASNKHVPIMVRPISSDCQKLLRHTCLVAMTVRGKIKQAKVLVRKTNRNVGTTGSGLLAQARQ
jgi:hypothetical protein